MKRKFGTLPNGVEVELVEHKIIPVSFLPNCDFCGNGTKAQYDFKTTYGSWANGCYEHYRYHAAYPTLGTGQGQMLIDADTVVEKWLSAQGEWVTA